MGTSLFEAGADDVVYLVDLSSYLLRAYHAVAPLSSPSGEPTHAVHGMVTMLERLLRERRPQLLAIAMDAGRDTFRRDIYPEYKAHRPPAPDDLKVQLQRAEDFVRASGYAVFKQRGVEADDLIASLATRAVESGLRVVIVAADKDLMQLVTERVVLWDTMRNKVFGVPEVTERFGVGPERLGDLLALMGDTSDNIPGVAGVGPKTAATLLKEHGDLEGILANLEAVKQKKLKQNLTESVDKARLSRQLVELKRDCDVDASREHLRLDTTARRNLAELTALYQELGFTRQLAALQATVQKEEATAQKEASAPTNSEATASASAPAAAKQDAPPPKKEPTVTSTESTPDPEAVPITIVTTEKQLSDLIEALPTAAVALELHTVHPSAHRGALISAALTDGSRSWYLPFEHRYVGAPAQLKATEALSALLGALAQAQTPLLVHDSKRASVLAMWARVTEALPPCHDTLLASYLLDPERAHRVEELGMRYSIAVPDFDTFSKEGRKKRPLDELEVEPSAKLASARVLAVWCAGTHQGELLEEAHMVDLLTDVELPLARQLAKMEVLGVHIDSDILKGLGADCEVELSGIETEAKAAAGHDFNLASPRQLETILFDEIGLKPKKRTKTSRSTDAQTLEALEDEHALPGLILRHRQIAKLKGTYIDALPALVNKETGRVHGSWEQAVAATGRLSSTDPNLQNIPIRSELGRKIRAAFTAPAGYTLVSADYSQIELRVLAHLSKDERLVEAFRTGQDVHSRTAMEIFEVAEDELTREMRARAKAVNFGVIYGQGESGLAKALGIERSVAGSFIAAYFRRYEGVQRFMNETLESARQGEAVMSILGRRRIIADIKSGNRARRLAAERIAMNMPIQGSAADILKLAMLALREPPTPGSRMVLTVHDELVFEVPDAEVQAALPTIREKMESAYQLIVPLDVSVGSGPNWNDAH